MREDSFRKRQIIRAARGVPLLTISRKVADLKAHLNTQLLVCSARKLSLTEAGSAYVAACKRILEQVDEAESQASGEYIVPRGTLAMTAPIVFGRLHVVPVVNEFLARFAQINVQLTLSDHTINICRRAHRPSRPRRRAARQYARRDESERD